MPLTSGASAALIAILILPLTATPIEPSLVTTLTTRDLPAAFLGLPGCNTKDTDPTWAPVKSKFKETDGVKIGDDCDNGYRKDHCWTDYIIVDYTNTAGPWYSPFGQVNCPSDSATPASMCNQQIGQLQQDGNTCKTTAWSVGGKIGTEIQDKLSEKWSFTLPTPEFKAEGGKTRTTCYTNSTTETCQWHGGTGCHQSWASQVVATVRGFKRRSCEKPTTDLKANMPNMDQRADGKYTRGMQDFEFPVPTSNTIDCDGGCQPRNSNPLPNQASGPIPWTWT